MVLQTERLVLRRWLPGDEISVAPIYAKPEVMRCIPGGTWDAERTARIVARMRELDEEQGYGFYPLALKDGGTLIGHAGLGHLEGGSEVEVAYVLDEPYWGRGLATEAARAILAHGLGVLGLPRIVAVAFPENPRSIAVMVRCGMRSCGLARHFGREVVKYETAPTGSAAR